MNGSSSWRRRQRGARSCWLQVWLARISAASCSTTIVKSHSSSFTPSAPCARTTHALRVSCRLPLLVPTNTTAAPAAGVADAAAAVGRAVYCVSGTAVTAARAFAAAPAAIVSKAVSVGVCVRAAIQQSQQGLARVRALCLLCVLRGCMLRALCLLLCVL